MKKFILLTGLMLLPLAATAAPTHCGSDKILNISSGRLIQLNSGQTFVVYPGQDTVSAQWEPQDKVTICALGGAAYQITNNGANHGTVNVLRQF